MKTLRFTSFIVFVFCVVQFSYAQTYSEELLSKAQAGDAVAQCDLGECYYEGKGIIQSEERAATFWKLAAERGDVDSQFILGVCYENGNGVLRDLSQAVIWYKKAAEQGYEEAQKALKRLGY